MSAAHWHLMLNHLPLLGIFFGAVLLTYGMWRNQEEVQNASLGLLVVAGLTAVAVYLTGEPAEEIVEGLAGVSHDAVEAHEEFAIYALIGGIVTSVVSLGALLLGVFRNRLPRWTVLLALVCALLTTAIVGYTSNLGGKISHPELRSGTVSTVEGGTEASSQSESEEHEEREEKE